MTSTALPTPELLAMSAMAHGGFTTPANEAHRLLEDACRVLRDGGTFTASLRDRVEGSILWLDERQDDHEVEFYRDRWVSDRGHYESDPSLTWDALRVRLMEAVEAARGVGPEPLEASHDTRAEAVANTVGTVEPEPVKAEPEPAPGPQSVDVSSVLVNVTMGESLRDQIDTLKKQLKVHEDMVKDVLGTASEGIDATGRVVVRYPERNRTNLVAKKVAEKLSPEDLAACQTHTSYRTLLYGDGA